LVDVYGVHVGKYTIVPWIIWVINKHQLSWEGGRLFNVHVPRVKTSPKQVEIRTHDFKPMGDVLRTFMAATSSNFSTVEFRNVVPLLIAHN